MKKSAFVTGGTGFLGSWLICALLKKSCYNKIFILARSSPSRSAETRLKNIFKVIPHNLKSSAFKRIVIVKGDVSEKNMGIQSSDLKIINKEVTDIFHSAAIAEFNKTFGEIRPANIRGTENIVRLANGIQKYGASEPVCLNHISTVTVAGTSSGLYREKDFDRGQKFNNAYEQSKFEAEKIIRAQWGRGLRAKIYHPAIVTGESKNGVTTNFKMIYQPVHFLKHGLFRELPANGKCLHSFVPVDKVAEAIALLCDYEDKNDVFHLSNPNEVPLSEYIESASRIFSFRKPNLTPIEKYDRSRLSDAQWRLIAPFVPYFNYRVRFGTKETCAALKTMGFEWPVVDNKLLDKLFRYCKKVDFKPPAGI